MRQSTLLAASAVIAAARILTPEERAVELISRAFPANQPHGYTPQTGACPSDSPKVRSAADLSSSETQWLERRRAATIDPLRDLLGRMNITGLDTNAYVDNNRDNVSALPNIAMAASGGGYRAMLNGAGIIQAFDSRTANSTAAGQLGGLLQSSTYLAGLSGGSWMVSSLYANNWTSVSAILAQDTPEDDSGSLWQLEQDIFTGPDTGGIQLLDSVGYFRSLVDSVSGKEDAGFNTSITDYWGRALSYQLVNATDGGPAYTWSSIAEQSWFTDGSVPLPLIVADSRSPGQAIVSSNSSVFTFTPWELGSDDPNTYAFAPLKYVGTNFTDGSVRSMEECVTGFDNVGFVFGTSSSLFNSIVTTVDSANSSGAFSGIVLSAVQAIASELGEDNDDIADWVNPFYHYNNDTNVNAPDATLTLVDGGTDGQNIPLHPLIQPNREVDVIFAIDSSADTNSTWPTDASAANWPNGQSMVSTYERSLSAIANGTSFPAVPDINTFINNGLASRPTFFGCDASNTTNITPLIVYIPNNPYVYNSNVATFDLQYNDTERNAIILNAYNGATQGNGTLDSEWPACVGCAILSRSLNRTGTDVPDICTRCFDRYCWDGSLNSTKPGDYNPPLKISDDEVSVTSGAGALSGTVGMFLTAAVVAGLAIL